MSQIDSTENKSQEAKDDADVLYIEPNPIVYTSDKRILVVDDEKYNLDAMKFILMACFKGMGKEEEIVDHLVDYCTDGQEAID